MRGGRGRGREGWGRGGREGSRTYTSESVGCFLKQSIRGTSVPQTAIRWSNAKQIIVQVQPNPRYGGKLQKSEPLMVGGNED